MKFKLGDKVIPISKTGTFSCDSIEEYKNRKYVNGTFLRKNGFLFVVGFNIDNEYILSSSKKRYEGDYFLEKDLRYSKKINKQLSFNFT